MAQPSPLAEVRDRANAIRDAGDPQRAIGYLHRALDTGRSSFGDDDPEVLRTGHLLAAMHRSGGDPSSARRILEEALAAGEFRLGDTHPVMLAIAFDLGVVADELGNRHEARRNLNRVADAGPAVLGDDHWQVTEARRYLRQWSVGESTPADLRAEADTTVVEGRPPFVDAGHSLARIEHRAVAGQPSGGGPAVPVVVAIGAAAAAVIAAVVVVIVGVTVLLDRPPGPSATAPADGPTPGAGSGGDPPGGLRLTDDGTAVTLSWSDPTAGTVPFMVASGREGQQLAALATVNPGRTVFTVNGLNSELDYCFAVLAVYSADEYVPSDQVCTQRRESDSN
ncbi:fibronectin type III domain-containing protein [Micromonospora sp. NBC_01813]|uniref:fibronectin type III domain-containing protein n=1 Tax=Micromonospora sp. NBC_01813 TaxID=2975988 RepID=UPI002DDA8C6A|nr:tetratricopeptide repeat protein [Micromonospora sp. NBC_01813]WSA10002.1 tetratricopeptide repeat protein [Micromonospora sp. NBC_01813]